MFVPTNRVVTQEFDYKNNGRKIKGEGTCRKQKLLDESKNWFTTEKRKKINHKKSKQFYFVKKYVDEFVFRRKLTIFISQTDRNRNSAKGGGK